MIHTQIDADMASQARRKLTQRQYDILMFCVQHVREHSNFPPIRTIGKAFEIASPNGVTCHMKALARKGFVRCNPNCGYELVLPE